MNSRSFELLFNSMTDTLNNWEYYTDFSKVYKNTSDINLRANLNLMNTLISSQDIRTEFLQLYDSYPNILSVVPIIIATRLRIVGRGNNKRRERLPIREYTDDTVNRFDFDLDIPNYSAEEYADLLEKTGIFELLSKHLVTNLLDYVTGVEVGLDSNARKNRTGEIMEDLVERQLVMSGYKEGISYFKQFNSKIVEEKFNVDLSSIGNKKFDFVIKDGLELYLVEVNFYSSSGSKPNETARSYENLAEKINQIPHVHFVWITDGAGWKNSKSNLEKVFRVLPRLYNLSEIRERGIKRLLNDELL